MENPKEINTIAKLASDPSRQQLAWANFTGPLSKYIADKHVLDYQNLDYATLYKEEDVRHFYGRFLEAAIKLKSLDSEVVQNEDVTVVYEKDGTTPKMKKMKG